LRGRLATECHYSQEYIDALDFVSAMKMAEYWSIEPPLTMLYRVAHFKQEEKRKAMNVIPQTGASKPWSKQPPHIKAAAVALWLERNPGKTAEDFEAQRDKEARAVYADRLQRARKEKASAVAEAL
jgi:hypothetical protein